MQLSDRIGRRMKLHDLHVLMAVVQAGSMNKAAALLNTGQSTISRSIAELERTVGVRLLDRSPQGVEPRVSRRSCGWGSADRKQRLVGRELCLWSHRSALSTLSAPRVSSRDR